MSRFFVLILGIVAGYVAFNFGSRIRQNVSGLLERENDSEDGEPKNGGSGSARVSKGADDGSVREPKGANDGSVREPKGANDGSAGESQKSSANKLFGSQSQPLTLAESIRRKIAEAQAEEAKAEADAQSGEARKKSDD